MSKFKTGFYTPRRVHQTPYFHLVANERALFTADLSEATVCITKKDCETLCEALEETSADNWEPLWVPPADPCEVCNHRSVDVIRNGFDTMNDPEAHLCRKCSSRMSDDDLYDLFHSISEGEEERDSNA